MTIVTALADRPTREALLKVSPKLDKPNFVEAVVEDLANTVRRVVGAKHPAAKPRHALNTFRWQLPETMPADGGPDVMIAEVHSIARIMSGVFYDLLSAIYTASGDRGEAASLWEAATVAGRLTHHASTVRSPVGGSSVPAQTDNRDGSSDERQNSDEPHREQNA